VRLDGQDSTVALQTLHVQERWALSDFLSMCDFLESILYNCSEADSPFSVSAESEEAI